MKDLNELAARVHSANIKWWQDIETGKPIHRNARGLLALVVSELAEALEGERKDLMDDKLPHRRMAEVEMADTVIRLLDFAGGFKIEIRFNLMPHGLILPSDKAESIFEMMRIVVGIQDGWDISLAICFIEAYCIKHGYDLEAAIEEKLAFNATRQDHTHEARRTKGGKRW